MKVIVPFAEGFEEIEAVTIVDVLRRADIDVTTAYIDKNPVTGSHNIPVMADKSLSELTPAEFNCIILPGGMPGSINLNNSDTVLSFIENINSKGGYTAAICAAPMVLGNAGLLQGKDATCYPGFEGEMNGANPKDKPVVVDGSVVTGRGAGCAIPFSLELVGLLKGKETMMDIKDRLQVYWM